MKRTSFTMLVLLNAIVCVIFTSVSDAFIVNTNGRPLISDGHSPSLGNLQGYAPVSADQQGGSPNFQQPNVLTGQKVQIQTASSRPVFGMFGQQQQQPTQCLPTSPNMQVPSGASQELFDYFNHLHATRQPFPNNQQQQQLFGSGVNYGQHVGNNFNNNNYNNNNNNNNNDNNNNNPPQNPIPQVTGTSGPLSVFSRPDYVPLSMQLTSQMGRPIYVTNNNNNNNNNNNENNNNNNQQPEKEGSPQLGNFYGNQNGNQAPSGGPSGGPVNQQHPYNPRTTQKPQKGPIGYQPINIGKRSVRETRVANSYYNQVNRPNVNKATAGYQGPSQSTTTTNNNNNMKYSGQMGAPSYFTDPFKYQMDQNNNPLPQRTSGSHQQGAMAFSDPSSFLGGSRFGQTQGTATQNANIGTQTEGAASTSAKHNNKENTGPASPKHYKEVTSGAEQADPAVSVPSSKFNQGGVQGNREAVNQGGLKDMVSVQSTKESSISEDTDSLIQEIETRDPSKVNMSPFNFFDPSSMLASNGRGKRHTLQRREAGFDPTKMNAGSFEPSKMAAGSFNPSSTNGVNGATSQNPSSHPLGHFDPSSMLAGSFNPGKGDAGQANPGSLQQQKAPERQTPPGQNGVSVGAQTGSQTGSGTGTQTGAGTQIGTGTPTGEGSQGSKPNPQASPGQGYDPDNGPSGSSFVPGSGGQFDPSAWDNFIGGK